MSVSRRDFIKVLGLSLAWIAVTRCGLISRDREDDTPRGRLRRTWAQLELLGERTGKDFEEAEKLRDQLGDDHKAILDELVASGELEQPVADQIQEAFQAAAYHIWRANAPITCYEPSPGPNYTPASSDQLARQSEILIEMAEKGKIEPATVAQAESAILRDIAFLGLTDEETEAFYIDLSQAAEPIYDFDKVEVEITPEAEAAARFLVDLLLGKSVE